MSWDATLDAYAAQLDAMQQALANRWQAVVPAFVPPTDLGPLPARLADRAADLLRQGAALQESLLGAREALEVAIRDVAPSRRPAPRPSMVDVRA